MKNLAGSRECDRVIFDELTRCGIQLASLEKVGGTEVPYTVFGVLNFGKQSFKFTRAWSYWCVEGPVPIDVAEELYANAVGKTDIRVDGNCTCPAPSESLVWFHADGREVSTLSNLNSWNDFISRGMLTAAERDKYYFTDTPEEDGCTPAIASYHIDSELGLYIFAQALKQNFSNVAEVLET